ncbi:MAG: glycosyltransferase [Desulfovibrionaceae bacterium]|nr:glycosyltransferase [Desulfovibrionaceae bacterium]
MIELKENDNSCRRVMPAFVDCDTQIIFESSDFFVPYLSIALVSLKQHISVEKKYDIIILSCDICIYNENKIKNIFITNENVSIRCFDVTPIVSKYIKDSKFKYFELCFCRLLLPWIFPNFKKILNLGADIIIERDIYELCIQQIPEEYYLAGVEDFGYQGRLGRDISFEDLSLKYPFRYVNADVLIYNLEKIRNTFTIESIMSVWQKKFLQCAEQDALNLIFDGKIFLLDSRWNIFPKRMSTEEYISNAPLESRKRYENIYNEPYIIHYAGEPKPWDFPDVDYAERWWAYARKSEYYELILYNMYEKAYANKSKDLLKILFPKGSLLRKIFKKCLPMGSLRYVYCKRILKKIHLMK